MYDRSKPVDRRVTLMMGLWKKPCTNDGIRQIQACAPMDWQGNMTWQTDLAKGGGDVAPRWEATQEGGAIAVELTRVVPAFTDAVDWSSKWL